MPQSRSCRGICWFKMTAKPGSLKITSFGEGVPENGRTCPAIVRLRPVIVVEPAAEGQVPVTEDVELIVVALTRRRAPTGAKEKLSAVDVARSDPPLEGGANWRIQSLFTRHRREAEQGETEIRIRDIVRRLGAEDPAADNTGPTTIEITPGTVNEMSTVDELEMVEAAALAGDTANVGGHPVDSAKAPMAVRDDVLKRHGSRSPRQPSM